MTYKSKNSQVGYVTVFTEKIEKALKWHRVVYSVAYNFPSYSQKPPSNSETVIGSLLSCRRFVEDEPLMSKLYITNIQPSDAGTYRCRASLGDFHAERDVQLKIFSKYLHHYLVLQFR